MAIRYVPVRPEGKAHLYSQWTEARNRPVQGGRP
jgi:hypothetical protein